MKTREAIYNFIINSDEYEKYRKRKKLISISSSIIFMIGFLMLFLMINSKENNHYFLIAGISLIILGFLYIFVLIPIFLRILRNNIYDQINKNILEWIKKEKPDIEIKDEKLKNLAISKKMNNYNYKKTNLSLMADDIEEKLKEIIKSL